MTTHKVSQNNKGTLLLLDNQDSFTYNLVDELAQLGFVVEVYRNTVELGVITQRLAELELAANIENNGPVTLVLSPGPGYPSQAGNLMALIEHCVGRYPLLGICLGFQAIVEHFGGSIERCNDPAHGKAATITTTGHPLFADLPQQLSVARYHSLQASQVPNELEIIAQYDTIPMAVCHREFAVAGLQFHPESIMTIQGSDILRHCIAFLETSALENHHA